MVDLDYYATTGYALELLAQSPYHKQQRLGEYFRVDVLPAIWASQVRIYIGSNGMPTAMITWAWINETVESDLHQTGRALNSDEWNCGDRLFFNDWITPYNNVREIIFDMSHNVFPDQIATGLRRNPDGSVRRINRWTGINLRHIEKKVPA